MASTEIESGIYYIQNTSSGRVLELHHGSTADGTKILGREKRELSDEWVSAQLWIIVKIDRDSVYTIQNANSRTYMDLVKGNAANGTPIVGCHHINIANQRWIITLSASKTAYVIKSQATGTYLDLFGGASPEASSVTGWAGAGASTSNTHQLWNIVRA
ncbi:ricin B-like lectin [Irpex lacteus]|nr:ricin B-like lectin [Irpex lacteus]